MADNDQSTDGPPTLDGLQGDDTRGPVDLGDREYAIYSCTDCANVVLTMQDCDGGMTCHDEPMERVTECTLDIRPPDIRQVLLDAFGLPKPGLNICLCAIGEGPLTPAELAEGIRALRDEGMRGLILDLRGNPGGRLRSAAEMAELFLEEGRTILTVESRRGVREEFRVTAEEPVFRRPLVVLVDGRSASASEILAGALRDHGRAVLVGARTFGKGSVQSVFGFDGGRGLKLTTARYLLPGGDAINGEGVAPDVAVGAAPGAGVVRMLQEHHLRRMDAEAFAAAFGFRPVGDRQLEVAGALLRGVLARRDAEPGERRAESPPEA